MSYSFGCRVNEAEKQLLDNRLLEMGVVWNEQHPTFYIINSCAVTGKAERETRQHIYQIRKKYPETKIILTGCSATVWMQNNAKPIGIDYVIDNANKSTIPDLISSLIKKQTQTNTISSSPDKFLDSGRMMIKIQDGCTRYCSYCIVPFLRGSATSETISTIVQRIVNSKKMITEVILTAINTEEFGKETNETLIGLLHTLLHQTTIQRISFGSIHPWSITPEFISWYSSHVHESRFVHFFHIPLQSGSDRILKKMNRQYSVSDIQHKLELLHASNPHALIATDIIVGFPGEGEKEFMETYNFLKNSHIVKFHIFRYSARAKTAAEEMLSISNTIDQKIKNDRAKKLTRLGNKKYKEFLLSHVGHTYNALFLQSRDNNYEQALLDNQIPIRVQTKNSYTGEIKEVRVQKIIDGSLIGILST